MAVNYNCSLLTPLLEDPTGSTVIFKGPQGRRKRPWRTVAGLFYTLFLCWQLTGMFLYAVRVIVCFKQRSLTSKCDPNAGFQHSADYEFVCLTTRSLHTIVVLTAFWRRFVTSLDLKQFFVNLKSCLSFGLWSVFS